MSKYIVKNCPCIVIDECNSFRDNEIFCEDCTDCVMKQIVERCKKVRENTADICTNPYEYATYCEARGVLQLLDIQEVK